MLITTTDTLQGFRIERYLGLVTGQAVLGDGISKKFRTGIREIGAGSPQDYGQELDRARAAATEHALERAQALGANAIVGASIAFSMSGEASRIVIVAVSGTAVQVATEHEARRSVLRLDAEPEPLAQDVIAQTR